MAYSRNEKLEKVYAARTDTERQTAYDNWSSDYDRDVSSFGIQLPYVGATVFARWVGLGTAPVLDAGCGTGMHTLPLCLMGYKGFHGIDLSEGMLVIAKERQIYDSLTVMALGQTLDFPDDHFEVTYSIGCLAPGNAPPKSLDEFIRVTKQGGLVIWSTHVNQSEQTKPYHDYRENLTEKGLWTLEFETGPFMSMPNGDSAIRHNIYVYKIT